MKFLKQKYNQLNYCIGDHVRCVATETYPLEYVPLNYPVINHVYTIRKIVKNKYGISLLLNEIVNYEINDGKNKHEPSFPSNRFVVLRSANNKVRIEKTRYEYEDEDLPW